MDAELLQLMRERKVFDQFKMYIRTETLNKYTATLLRAMGDFFEAHPTIDIIVWDSFTTWFTITKTGTLPAKEVSLYRTLLDKLDVAPSTSAVMSDVLDHFIRLDYAQQIADKAEKVLRGDDTVDMHDFHEIVNEYTIAANRATTKTDLFASFDLTESSETAAKNGWNWRLGELNESLGPIRGGDFVILGARPETGKTTFLAAEVSYIAEQMQASDVKAPVIWVNNEERHDKVVFRIMQAALGQESKVILADPAKAAAEFNTLVGSERILIPRSDAGFNNRKVLSALFKERRPAMIIFDQLDKVYGFGGKGEDREDLAIGQAYHWARDLAHEYDCPVITASQASADAEGMEYIGQDLLRGSKTDKPGEADAIITIGRNDKVGEEYKRFINVPKNKLFGGSKSKESMRHGRYVVDIDPTIARYIGRVL